MGVARDARDPPVCGGSGECGGGSGFAHPEGGLVHEGTELRHAEARTHGEQTDREQPIRQLIEANEQLVLTSLTNLALREQLSAAIEASGVGTFRWDASTDVLHHDGRLAPLFGYAQGPEPRNLAAVLERVHDDDRNRVLDSFRVCAHGGSDLKLDFRAIWPDKSVCWLSVHGRLSRDPLRERSVYGACTDITERKRIATEEAHLQALSAAEQRSRVLIDAMPQLVWTADAAGHIDYANARWLEYSGHAAAQGRHSLAAVLAEADRARVLHAWQTALEQGSDMEVQTCLRRHDGVERWFLIRAVPLADGLTRKWFGTCTDIEDQKRAEVEVQKANSAKDEFLAMLSHELRNPLASVVAATHILKHRRNDLASQEYAVGLIDRQVDHLVRLVDDLLDVARVTRGKVELKRETVRVAHVVAAAVELASELIDRRGHQLDVSMDEELEIEGDQGRLVQALANMLVNAAKYTPERGRLRLTARREQEWVILEVDDNGVGIAAELIPHIFDPFVQGKRTSDRAQGGLGVGLTVAREVIRLHGGDIRVTSGGHGAGSLFTACVPALPCPTRARDSVRTIERKVVRAPLRVLLVDDRVEITEVLSSVLQSHGHTVAVAYDGLSGLETALTFRPDVAVLDIGLPGMSGHELARELRTRLAADCPRLVALTGYGQAKDRALSFEAGFDEHLVKPVQIHQLFAAVENA